MSADKYPSIFSRQMEATVYLFFFCASSLLTCSQNPRSFWSVSRNGDLTLWTNWQDSQHNSQRLLSLACLETHIKIKRMHTILNWNQDFLVRRENFWPPLTEMSGSWKRVQSQCHTTTCSEHAHLGRNIRKSRTYNRLRQLCLQFVHVSDSYALSLSG